MKTTTEVNFDRLPILSREEIVDRLMKHDIPLQKWGTGKFRTLEDFVRYMTNDCFSFRTALPDESSAVMIDVHAIIVIVLHNFRRKWWELHEDRQEFKNNGEILRRKKFNGIAETLRRGETLRMGAMRCLREELSFRDQAKYELSYCMKVEHRDPVPSEKWPGIIACYHRYIFECIISREIFKRGGYREDEGDRIIHFLWKPRGQMQFRL